MELIDWRTFPGGGTKRAALWLIIEVGEGETFTKSQLRAAFPGESQIDRRVRDLRDEGWVIHTNRDDVSLRVDEQRLVSVGGRVWEKGYQTRRPRIVTARERQAVFASDNYACSVCGILGGEPYPEDPLSRAKLTLASLTEHNGVSRLATVCERCHRGRAELPDLEGVRRGLGELSPQQRGKLVEWVQQGRRNSSLEERIWADYRRLPGEAREEFRKWLLAQDGQD